jgi:DNA relaxase NicK
LGIRFKSHSEYDWYQATIHEDLTVILETLLDHFPGVDIKQGSGWKGYESTVRGLDNTGSQLFMLAYGGSNGHPNLTVSGDHANEWARVVKSTMPAHAVTRVDVALDRIEPGLFDRLLPEFIDTAKRSGVSLLSQGDWHSDVKSRTIYAGAPASRVRVRMYEKGREILSKHGQAIPGLGDYVSPDWIRCEVQIRPSDRQSRQLIKYVPIEELWGASGVSRSIIEQIEGLVVPRLELRALRIPTTVERGMRNCLNQYGKTMSLARSEWGHEEFHSYLDRELSRL